MTARLAGTELDSNVLTEGNVLRYGIIDAL
jgi:hypothetical protein